MSVYIRASTNNPTGRRPWGYKLGAYYQADFAVPNPNEVGPRLSGSFNKPGGMTSTNWGNKDNPGAPRPLYRVPELLPRHYGRLGSDSPDAPVSHLQPLRINIYEGQPASAGPAVASNGQPIANPAPVTLPAAPATTTTSSLSDMYSQAVAWLESSTLISSWPNYVPVGVGLVGAYLLMNRGGGNASYRGRR